MSICISAVFAVASYAAPVGGSSAFPFGITFDLEKCDRICYAGHPNNTVIYKDGIAVTPETSFRVVSRTPEFEQSPNDLSVSISLIYENDTHSGSYRETVKQYNAGDLNYTDDFRLISDTVAESLDLRDKLYSDSLIGFEMTLNYKSKDIKKKTLYLYVCSEDDYEEYLMNSPEECFDDEPEQPDDFEG